MILELEDCLYSFCREGRSKSVGQQLRIDTQPLSKGDKMEFIHLVDVTLFSVKGDAILFRCCFILRASTQRDKKSA